MAQHKQEAIVIWLIGNTGLRNPIRIHDGFSAFAESPYVGNLHGKENEIGFMEFLSKSGIINNAQGKDCSGSHARKWRLMFERYGFIYGPAKKINGFSQEQLGPVDTITPFGQTFLKADTPTAIQSLFLRALSVEQYWLPDRTAHFSPFRWVLALMLELEKRTGSSEISRLEFGLWGHTTNPSYDINYVVDQILDLRKRYKAASAKRPFVTAEINSRAKYYREKKDNFLDYSDMNMRYLRMSGILQRKGRGLMIVPAKRIIAETLAKSNASTTSMLDEFINLTQGAPLPSDDINIAKRVLMNLEALLKERHISYDITDFKLDSLPNIEAATNKLENILSQTNEIVYAAEQREKWQEIADYMTLLIKGGGYKEYNDEYKIEVPRDEAAAYLEWTLWRATLAINHLANKPYEVRGFSLDADFMPISTAGGGKGDLYCDFDDFTILTEVTLSTSSRQEAMEGEPVRRHVADAVEKYNKPVYGMFIAVKVDTNTAETFRHGVWYDRFDQRKRLNIVPLTLSQFKYFFTTMFEREQAIPQNLCNLLTNCMKERDVLDAPQWKEYINNAVKTYF